MRAPRPSRRRLPPPLRRSAVSAVLLAVVNWVPSRCLPFPILMGESTVVRAVWSRGGVDVELLPVRCRNIHRHVRSWVVHALCSSGTSERKIMALTGVWCFPSEYRCQAHPRHAVGTCVTTKKLLRPDTAERMTLAQQEHNHAAWSPQRRQQTTTECTTKKKKHHRLAHNIKRENYTAPERPPLRRRCPHIIPQQEFWLLACL